MVYQTHKLNMKHQNDKLYKNKIYKSILKI